MKNNLQTTLEAYNQGYRAALRMARENFLTPSNAMTIMDCVKIIDVLLDTPDWTEMP